MEALLSSEYFPVFLIIVLGIGLGKLRIKGIGLESSAVLFVALVFGHYGVQVPSIFQKLGLLLFIFAVGIQAGPGFFTAFRHSGAKVIGLAVLLVLSGAGITALSVLVLDVDPTVAVGLFTGSLTSTPGLAAAIESAGQGASIGYGIAYPFGVIGVILFVNLVPRVLRIDIKQQDEAYKRDQVSDHPELLYNHYLVENPNVDGKSVAELALRHMTGANLSRVRHLDKSFVPTHDTKLFRGDLVRAVGDADALRKVELLIGPPTKEVIELDHRSTVEWVLVTNKDVVNKSLGELNLFQAYNTTITRIRRAGVDITPKSHVRLRFGDKVMIVCRGNAEQVMALLGNEDKMLTKSDFLPVAAGLVVGLLLGLVRIPLPGGLSFELGLTGGVLTAALVLSFLGKTGPIIWNVAGPANLMLKQVGLLFFLASVGTSAGANLVETLSGNGLSLFLVGVAITMLPMMLAFVIGWYVMKINLLTLLGVITGGMTSTPGLTAVDAQTESDAPGIGYATVYPAALVGMIVCSQLLAML